MSALGIYSQKSTYSKMKHYCQWLILQSFNPFRTAKAARNGNHRLCLKSKTQAKCD